MSASPAASRQRKEQSQSLTSSAADKLVQIARTAPLHDGGLASAEILSHALLIDPHHHEARLLLENLRCLQAPRWHFPMLGDAARNAAYRRAIEAKVRTGDIVLDIGCGAGLTAMLAARAGARHVYSCEVQPALAAAAQKIIAANGLSERITVIPKHSQDLRVGVDLPEPADLVVSEIVDCVLLGEGALQTLEHAMTRLAKPEARALPESGTLYAQLIESESLFRLWRPDHCEGFDFSEFHKFASVANMTPQEFAAHAVRPLAAREPLFSFDFRAPSSVGGRIETTIPCTRSGAAHAVAAVFDLNLAPGATLSNHLDAEGHWGRKAFLLDAPRAVAPGEALRVVAEHDGAALSIALA